MPQITATSSTDANGADDAARAAHTQTSPQSGRRKTLSEAREGVTTILTSVINHWAKNPKMVEDFFGLVGTICQNIITHPKVSLFRRIDSRRSLFKNTIAMIKGGPQLLLALGFRLDEDLYYNYDFANTELLKHTATKIFEMQRKLEAKEKTHIPVYHPPINRIKTMPLPPTPVLQPAVDRHPEAFLQEISQTRLDPRARAYEILETIEARILRFDGNYLLNRQQSTQVLSQMDGTDTKHGQDPSKKVIFELPFTSVDSLERVPSSVRVIEEENTLLKEEEKMKSALRRAEEERKKREAEEKQQKEKNKKQEAERLAKMRKTWEETHKRSQSISEKERKKKNKVLRRQQEEHRRKRIELEKRFSVGDEVVVHSLRQATKLNGVQGEILGKLRTDHRWPVRVTTRDGKRQTFNFLNTNLKPKVYNLTNREMSCMAKLIGMGFSAKDSRHAAMRASGNLKKALQYATS